MRVINLILRILVNRIPYLRYTIDYIERKINRKSIVTVSKLSEGFSFVIVTDGHSIVNLKKSIVSILDEFDTFEHFEIIVVGQNANYPIYNNHIKYVPYHGIWFMPGWITFKKNIGAKSAKYDKLVIMHDYLSLCKGWLNGFEKFTNNFDVCTNIIKFIDGRRARDWTVYDYPKIGAALLPYDCISDYIYISGAYFVVKTQFYMQHPLDEKRRWGESEDVEWTKRIRVITQIKLNKQSCCQFVKNKPMREAPYEDSWIDRTIKLYNTLGYSISEETFEEYVNSY